MSRKAALLSLLALISVNCGDVGPEGGLIVQPGGVSAVVSPNSFPTPTPISLASVVVQPSDFALIPSGFSILGAVRVSFSGVATKPLALALALSEAPAAGSAFILAKVVEIGGAKRFSLVDTATFDGSALLSSAAPPFPGVIESGTYAFFATHDAGLATFRTSQAFQALADVVVESLDRPSAFLALSASDGFAALAFSLDSAPNSILALSTSVGGDVLAAQARLSAASMILLSPPAGPSEFPTIPDIAVQLLLERLGVDVNHVPDAIKGCNQEPIVICPSALPEDIRPLPGRCPFPRFDPFEPGDEQQLEIICIGEGPCDSDDLSSLLTIPSTGFDIRTIAFKAFGTVKFSAGRKQPLPLPVAVSLGGLVSAIEPGVGSVVAVATKRCLRKGNFGGVVVANLLIDQEADMVPFEVTCPRCGLADLKAIAAPGGSLEIGRSKTLNFFVQNAGPEPASGVAFDVTLPADLSVESAFFSFPVSGACATSPNRTTCPIGDLPVGGTTRVDVTVRGLSPGRATVTGSVAGAAFSPDPDLSNNVSSTVVDVTCPAQTPQFNVSKLMCEACPAGTVFSSATNTCGAPKAMFLPRTTFFAPLSASGQVSTELNFSGPSKTIRAGLTSRIGTASIDATLEASNETCERFNGASARTDIDVFLAVSPGTPFRIERDSMASAVGNSKNEAGNLLAQAGTDGVNGVSLDAVVDLTFKGTSSDSKAVSGRMVDTGITTGRTLESGGIVYSFAISYSLQVSSVTNGQCATCEVFPGCCDCGFAKGTATLRAVVLPH